MITSFNNISLCALRKKETIKAFKDHFRALDAAHLEHVKATPSSQVGHVLAITLLNNAKLKENALTSAKFKLISLAEDRRKS